MIAYILHSDANKYQNLLLTDVDKDWEVIYKFDGSPLSASWHPLKVEVNRDDKSQKLPAGDSPSLFATLPVFSRRAVEGLKLILKGNGEFLPLECKDGDYVAFNVTNIIDTLNVEHSEVVYFSSGKILDIKRFVFNAERIPASGVFKIPQMLLGYIFVTEDFVRLVRESGLQGFLFTPVDIINSDI